MPRARMSRTASSDSGCQAAMATNGQAHGPAWEYSGSIDCSASGQYGFAVRVLPKNEDLGNPFEPGLVTWGG